MEYREEIKKAMDYIEEHLDQEIRAADAADMAGFSQYHFYRIFKKETGLSLYQYITNLPLSRASISNSCSKDAVRRCFLALRMISSIL